MTHENANPLPEGFDPDSRECQIAWFASAKSFATWGDFEAFCGRKVNPANTES